MIFKNKIAKDVIDAIELLQTCGAIEQAKGVLTNGKELANKR